MGLAANPPHSVFALTAAWLRFHPLRLVAAAELAWLGMRWSTWLLYLVGVLVLGIGLRRLLHEDFSQQRSLEKLVSLGPVFLAVAIAVFGTQHLVFAQAVAGMVPSWMPAHLFWALFVGVCLVCSALSIALTRHAGIAALLLGFMVLLFVLLLHIPGILHAPGERLPWVIALRDLSFAGGAFAVAAMEAKSWEARVRQRLVLVARLFVGAPIIFLGVQQLLHPELAPGVPLEQLTPSWIPVRLLWAFLAGSVFIVTGVALVVNRQARLAATWLGLMILILIIVVYVPIVVAKPSDIGNGMNYLFDTLLLAGSVLALAGAARWDLPGRSGAVLPQV